MAKANTKLGDVFTVKIDENNKRFFQFITTDLTQLNSDVIRAFSKVYPTTANPDLQQIVVDEVEFYAHCVTKLGLSMGFWQKVGNICDVGNFNHVLFRSSADDPRTKISKNWWVWKINEEQKEVGLLNGDNRSAEIGSVIPPDSIVHRLKNGTYDFVYPGFK